MDPNNRQVSRRTMRRVQPPPPPPPPPPCTHTRTILVQPKTHLHSHVISYKCEEKGYGIHYKCSSNCDYYLHKQCHRLNPPFRAYHPFFENRLFSLYRQQSTNNPGSSGLIRNLCDTCGKLVKGWMYQTNDNDASNSIFLHPSCMHLSFSNSVSDNREIFMLKKELETIRCHYCNNTSLRGRIKGWAYVSNSRVSSAHIKCIGDMYYEDFRAYREQRYVENNTPRTYNGDLSIVPWVDPSRRASQPTARNSYNWPI